MPKPCCKEFYAKIPDDEPVFTIAGRDALAAQTVAFWIEQARLHHCDPSKISRAEAHLADIMIFQQTFPDRVKMPD